MSWLPKNGSAAAASAVRTTDPTMTRAGKAHQRLRSRSWAAFRRCSQPASGCGSARVNISKAAAGVTVIATTSDASVAMMNAAASGLKNFPCSPDSNNMGVSTSTTTNVAYTTGARTSTEAACTTSRTAALSRTFNPWVPRKRLTMFSTPMIASSTTTPSATASPPSVIVLMVQPSASTAITVLSNASGIEAKVTSTLRKSRRKRNSTRVMSTAPSSTSSLTPRNAFSMKFAGRCMLG